MPEDISTISLVKEKLCIHAVRQCQHFSGSNCERMVWRDMKNHFHTWIGTSEYCQTLQTAFYTSWWKYMFLVKILYWQCTSQALCKVSSSTSQRLSMNLVFGLRVFVLIHV